MRGRTNVSGGSSLNINANITQKTIIAGQNVIAGDMVDFEQAYEYASISNGANRVFVEELSDGRYLTISIDGSSSFDKVYFDVMNYQNGKFSKSIETFIQSLQTKCMRSEVFCVNKYKEDVFLITFISYDTNLLYFIMVTYNVLSNTFTFSRSISSGVNAGTGYITFPFPGGLNVFKAEDNTYIIFTEQRKSADSTSYNFYGTKVTISGTASYSFSCPKSAVLLNISVNVSNTNMMKYHQIDFNKYILFISDKQLAVITRTPAGSSIAVDNYIIKIGTMSISTSTKCKFMYPLNLGLETKYCMLWISDSNDLNYTFINIDNLTDVNISVKPYNWLIVKSDLNMGVFDYRPFLTEQLHSNKNGIYYFIIILCSSNSRKEFVLKVDSINEKAEALSLSNILTGKPELYSVYYGRYVEFVSRGDNFIVTFAQGTMGSLYQYGTIEEIGITEDKTMLYNPNKNVSYVKKATSNTFIRGIAKDSGNSGDIINVYIPRI